MSLISNLKIQVEQEGARETEVAVNAANKAVERGAKSAQAASEEYKNFASRAGDASEALDKKLEGSVGRVFKSTDRLASVVGQVATAFGLLGLAAGAAKAAYDKYAASVRKRAELQQAHADIASTVDALQAQAKALGSVRPQIEAYVDVTEDGVSSLDRFAEALRRDIAALEDQAEATRQARAEAVSFFRSIADSEFDIDLDQRVKLLQAKMEFEAAAAALAVQERKTAEATRGVNSMDPLFVRAAADSSRQNLARARAEFDGSRAYFEEVLEGARAQTAKLDAQAKSATRPASDGFNDPGGFDLGFSPEELEQQNAVAFAARERALAEAESQRAAAIASLERDNDRRIDLLDDRYEREFEALRTQHDREREEARRLGDDLALIDEQQQRQRTKMAERHARERIDAQVAEAKATTGAVSDVSGAVASASESFGASRGLEMFALGVQDAAAAASYTADSIGAFARYDYGAGAMFAAAAAAKAVSAAQNFKGASSLGEGGGSAPSAGGASRGGAGRSELGGGPRQDEGERSVTINANFSGQPLVTRPDIEDAVVRALNGASRRRGAPRLRSQG